jgi:hypothetical protein
MALTVNAQKQVLRQETPAAFIHLIEMEIASEPEPFRVTDDSVDRVHKGETFKAIPFEIKLSSENVDFLPTSIFQMDNVSREIAQILIEANPFSPIKCNLTVLSSLEPDEVQRKESFFLKSGRIAEGKVRCSISYNDTMNNRFPNSTMNTVDFKAIG